MEPTPSTIVLERDPMYRAALEASRAIGLDFAPCAGRPALWMSYQLESEGLQGWVLIADGAVRGAWLRVDGTDRIIRLDHREEALGAATNPRVTAIPTPDPNSIGDRANLAEHSHLRQASDAWVRGPVRGGLIRDTALREQLLDALDTEVQVGLELVPPDVPSLVLVGFEVGGEVIAFRYYPEQGRVYLRERGIVFFPPPAFAAALKPLYRPDTLLGMTPQPIRPTTAPVDPAARSASR